MSFPNATPGPSRGFPVPTVFDHTHITARGGEDGGDGGFVEVSGESSLRFRGNVDTTAPRGKAGTLLLDPRNIAIANGEPLMEIEDAERIADDIFNGSVRDKEDVTIYESQLEGLSGQTNVILQATNDIRLADLADDSLSLAVGTGEIKFIADADNDGAGDFSMENPADTINTNGRDIAITGASLTIGNIDTSLPAADGAVQLLPTAAVVSSGAITLRASNGNITALDLNAASFSGAAGEIILDAAADIRLDGSQVDASGVVGGGGDIILNSGGEIELNSSFLRSSTNGEGDAGKVTITSRDTVSFSGGGASSNVNSDAVGSSGGIEITTATLNVTDGGGFCRY